MGEFLRNLGISESGIDPPALHVVMGLLICVVVHAQLRNRDRNSSIAVLMAFYIVAFVVTVATTVLVFRIENETVRYLIALIYITAIGAAVHFPGRRYL